MELTGSEVATEKWRPNMVITIPVAGLDLMCQVLNDYRTMNRRVGSLSHKQMHSEVKQSNTSLTNYALASHIRRVTNLPKNILSLYVPKLVASEHTHPKALFCLPQMLVSMRL